LYINLGSATFASLDAADKAGAPLIKYGLFINNVVNFLIIAGSVFLMVKGLSKLKLNIPVPPPPPTPEQVLLLREIRDALKAQAGDGIPAA
jgi:large conductance mechanosensitive channel